MPVDKARLEAYAREVAGGDTAVETALLTALGANEAAATNFTSGFLRRDDYTRKTQDVARTKQEAEELVTQYAQQVEEAENKTKKVLRDLADQKITTAGAQAQLDLIAEKYQIPAEDMPTRTEVVKTATSGKVPAGAADFDIDTRMAEFETRILKNLTDKLVPELSSMASLPAIWSDIEHEHQELTGKRLTRAEKTEILTEAQKNNTSLIGTWEKKYDVSSIRTAKNTESAVAAARVKWEQEQTAKRTEEAMQGVKGRGDIAPEHLQSPLLKHEFALHEDPISQPGEKAPISSAYKPSGADRAAQRYLERRAAGTPMGAPDPKAA